jgi:(E)-4-hydroxy-3-methylbut-2-enyl-diphosphate synthase
MKYCPSIFKTERFKTREVMVGNVGVGGNNPIRIQSMTTSSTRDTKATIDQIMALSDRGCEIARVTVQGIQEAKSCEAIKNGLLQLGYNIPLVADIHFFPEAAMRVVDFVEKVRINPGNFVDKRATFKIIEYDDLMYAQELEKIEEKLAPLIEKCKRLKRAMRIGTNHGSLSDRIMNRYGDTAQGMVESALEFARVCRKYDYHNFVFSMKASNPQVMILAYRLLVAKMIELGWDYPLHLGVTEAGLGEDGRIKSAMGIGSLLLDGIGDTIRVSLTEDACHEIDPCKRLIAFAKSYEGKGVAPFEEKHRNIESIEKRPVLIPKNMHKDGAVITSSLAPSLVPLQDIALIPKFGSPITVMIQNEPHPFWSLLKSVKLEAIVLAPSQNRLHYARAFFEWLKSNNIHAPVILKFKYECSKEDLIIQAGAEFGALFCDKLGEGIWIDAPYEEEFLRSLSLNILQAARMRMSKTDFISCPSCGRTLFDLQDVSKRIQSKTAHLPGVKIAIMGCIVNGPGEMADADFGYVGSKPGKIDLYVGKECVQRDVDFADADDRLVDLIKEKGLWVEVKEGAQEGRLDNLFV